MKKFSLIFCVSLLPGLMACGGWQTKDTIQDFTTEGFVSDHTFQALVTEKAPKNARGLIERREGAYFVAKERVRQRAVTNLRKYMVQLPCAGQKPADLRERDLSEYEDQGHIAEEYYNAKDTVTLVFRIRKKGLKEEIESLACP